MSTNLGETPKENSLGEVRSGRQSPGASNVKISIKKIVLWILYEHACWQARRFNNSEFLETLSISEDLRNSAKMPLMRHFKGAVLIGEFLQMIL